MRDAKTTKLTLLELIISAFICAGIVVILYRPVIFGTMFAVNRTDAIFSYLPWGFQIARGWTDPALFVWNPFFNLGQPSIGANPLSLVTILYVFLDPWWANTVYIVFGLWCLFFVSWLYMRNSGFSKLPAFIGVFTYSFSGIVFYFHSYQHCLTAFIFLPLLLLVISAWDSSRRLVILIFLGVLIFIFVQSSAFDKVLYVFSAIFFDRIVNITRNKEKFFCIFIWVVVLASAYLMLSFFFVPLNEWLRYSVRGFIPQSRVYPSLKDVFLTINLAKLKGPFSYHYYIGLPAIVLGLIGLIKGVRKDSSNFRFFILTLLFPVGYIIFRILHGFGFPFLPDINYWRGMMVFMFGFSVMAASGARYLMTSGLDKKFIVPRRIILAILVVFTITMNTSLAYRHLKEWCYMGDEYFLNYVRDYYDYVSHYMDSEPGRGRMVSYSKNKIEFSTVSNIRALFLYSNVHNKSLTEALKEDGLMKDSEETKDRWWSLLSPDAERLAVYGVRYVLLDNGFTVPDRFKDGWRKADEFRLMNIWENEYYKGRAYILSKDGRMKDDGVLVEDISSVTIKCTVGNAKKGDRMVISDLSYPGWEVSVNGQRADWDTYNGCMREVRLLEGKNTVIWHYNSSSMKRGLLFSSLAAVIFMLSLYSLYKNSALTIKPKKD